MFSSQQTLTALLNSNAAATRKLNASARTLTACSKRVKALGAAPPKYRHARAAALRACDHFEVGADLVKLGLIAAQGGLGSDLLVEGASKLSDGVGSIPASELKGSSKKDQEIEDEANQLRQGS